MRRFKNQHIRSSIRVLQVTMIGFCLILVGRLYQLQILDFDTYNPLSKKNSIRQEYVNPARGLIYDRNGNLLVDNEPIYTITITPSDYDTTETPLLAQLLGVKISDLNDRIDEAKQYSWYRKSRLYSDVNFKVFSRIQENIWRLPGIGHQIESKRHYPAPAEASHILGYLREVSEKVYNESDRYQLGDKIGRSGLEAVYENFLRGHLGTSYKLINAFGQEMGPYDDGKLDENPVQGADLYTTIDTSLQAMAEKLMANKPGAIVALDPRDGSVLALVSSPEYDLSKISGRLDKNYWQKINTDTLMPLYNRAISAQEPPGSTFKPLLGLIGLHMGLITPNDIVHCTGVYYKGRAYKDEEAHGNVNLEKAIQVSCNVYFFTLMDKIASTGRLNEWYRYAKSFGLGSLNYIDLPGENSGILPDSSYFNKTFGVRKWSIGDVINLGIGQGVLSVTPLQMALVAAELGNGGYKIQPHIVRAIRESNGTVLKTHPIRKKIAWVSEKNLSYIQAGMRRVVTEGTARWYANVNNIKIAGKTGTAQNPHGNDHAWFISFAPYKNPKIAMAVFVENAGFGATTAVPISTLLIEKYLTGHYREWLYKQMLKYNPYSKNNPDQAK